MERRTVQLRVGGQTYRVVSSASEVELQRLAEIVEGKLAEVVPPGRAVTSNSVLLAALALAHDLEEERGRREELERRSREVLRKSLTRVNEALHQVELPSPEVRRRFT